MCLSYKWNLATTSALCDGIEKNAEDLGRSMYNIKELASKVLDGFEALKDVEPEFSKLKVKVAKLKEYHPKLQDQYEEKREHYLDVTNMISVDLVKLFSEIEDASKNLKKIIFDADALIYKENKRLNRHINKLKHIKNKQLREELIVKINEVKQDMRSITRKLFESARKEEKEIFTSSLEETNKIPLSSQIRKLGIEIDAVGMVLNLLDIDDIDDIVRKSEEELTKLKKVELEVLLVMKRVENHFIDIKNKIYLFEDEVEAKMREKLVKAEKNFDNMKAKVTKNARNLFADITIVKEIVETE